MTQHSTTFEIERPVPADDAVGMLPARPVAATPAPAQKKLNLRKMLLTGAALAALAGAAWYGWDYWTVGQYLVSTDDAYVKADNTTIAPKVSGYLHEVLVGDNERVKAGQMLARIDDRDFKVALDQAKADVAAAQAAIASKQAQLDVQQAVINAAKATVDVDERHRDFRRAGKQALHRSGRDRLWQRAERAAGAVAHRRRPGRDPARHRQPRLRAQAGRPAQGRDRPGQRGAGARRGRAEPGRTQSRLHHHRRPDRRHRRQPHAAHRPVRAGRHAIDVGGAGERRLCRRELQGNPAHRRARGPGGRYRRRHVPRPGRARPCRQHRARQRPGIRAAAAGQRHRQFHQGGAAHPGQDRARRRQQSQRSSCVRACR